MGKMYGVRFDLWVAGRLEPQLILFEKEDPPTEREIISCVWDRAKLMEGELFGSESAEPEVQVEYRSGVANDQELWGRDPGFGAFCQEVKVEMREEDDE
ncbi:MAG: hypothetical protein ACE5K9_02305 [Candidatus Methylomirabilales bacterium]